MCRIYISLFVVTAFLFASCQSRINKSIYGDWVIERSFYKDKKIKECLLLNLITFEANNVCKLPISKSSCTDIISNASDAHWELIETDSVSLILKIESTNVVFSGKHRVIFNRDEYNNLFRMEVISDSLYILCNRPLYDYSADQEAMNELVEISHRDQATWPPKK